MSRPSNAQRAAIAAELNKIYQTYISAISGDLSVNLYFDSNPRRWFITADTSPPGASEGFYPTNIRITACLSTQWLTAYPPRTSFFTHSKRPNLVAGHKDLPIPSGIPIEAVQFVSFTDKPKDSTSTLRLAPYYGFLIHAHGTSHLCGISPYPPKNFPRAIGSAYQEFRAKISAAMAKRLLPSRQP